MPRKKNYKNAFEREINLCQDFQYHELKTNDDLIISFNVYSGEITIWVHFDKTWDVDRGIKILNKLLICRKLDQFGYQISWTAVEYSVTEWDNRTKICCYTCKCRNFKLDVQYRNSDYSYVDFYLFI